MASRLRRSARRRHKDKIPFDLVLFGTDDDPGRSFGSAFLALFSYD
jgi:hypothetical protein